MRKLLLASLASATLLAGCLFPEKFDASVTINPDRSHNVKFDGAVVVVPAQKDKTDNGGKLSKVAENAMEDMVKGIKKDKIFKSAKRSGDTSVDVSIDHAYGPKEGSSTFDALTVRKMPDGTIQIRSPKLAPNDLAELKKLKMSLDGTIRVYLPANARVVETNAQSKPGLIDKSYGWKIKDPQDAIFLVVRLK